MEKYSEYKDSGVQWLGKIPGHWDVARVKNIMREKKESAKGDEEQLSVTQAYGIIKSCDAKISNPSNSTEGWNVVHVNDIVFNKYKAHSGVFFASPYEGIVTFNYSVFKCFDYCLPKFYEKLYRTPLCISDFKKLMRGVGESISPLYTSLLYTVRVPLPPLSEQQAIVSYLDDKCGKIDQLLENKEKELELLTEMKQRVIADAVTKGLNPDVTMKDSGIPWLPHIPEHWDVQRAKNLYKKEQRPVQDGDDIVTCFRDGQVTLRKNRRTTGFTEATNFTGYQHICKGDLVIHQMDAFAGSSGVSDSDGMGTPVLSVCTAKTPLVDNYYYAHILRLMGKNGFILSLYRGIRERSSDFRFDTFARQWLPIPPIEEQKAIVAHIEEKVSKIDALSQKLQQEIDSIKEYKQRLISDVVTGQIKVCQI